jgi:hypothetical protein
MTFAPRRIELPFTYQGHAFTAVFNMATIARFEEDTGQSVIDFVTRLGGGGSAPRISDLGRLLLAALGEHHPDLTLEHAMELITQPQVQALFTKGIAAAMPQPGDIPGDGPEAGGTPAANPPKGKAGAKP